MAMKDVSDLQVCQAYVKLSHERLEFPYITLSRQTGQCQKVCYRAMERALRRGLIDCGVSLRTGWLTDKGKELIAKAESQMSQQAGKQLKCITVKAVGAPNCPDGEFTVEKWDEGFIVDFSFKRSGSRARGIVTRESIEQLRDELTRLLEAQKDTE